MYEKILAELIKQNSGQSKVFLGILATRLEKKITDETTIEGVVTELTNNTNLSVADLAEEWQKEGDRRITEYKANNPNPNDPKPPKKKIEDPNNPPTETAAEKKLRELEEKYETLAKAQTDKDNRAALLGKLSDKKIPAEMAEGIVIEDITKLDEIVTGIETRYKVIEQNVITTGLKTNQFVPASGVQSGDSAAIQAEIAAWAKQTNPVTPSTVVAK